MAELRDLATALAGGGGAKAAAAGGGGAAVKWNALQLSSSGAKAATGEADVAAWHVEARYQRAVWCMR